MTPVSCGSCGRTIDAPADQALDKRAPCPSSGSMTRKIEASASGFLEWHESLDVKLRRKGSSKVAQHQRVGDSLSRRDGVWCKEELLIDREADRYRHPITDTDGTVIHHDESKLSEHRGHGSARTRKAR